MIRISLLWFFVAVVSVYAWRDWYKALCGLVLLMAVIEHPDMPKSIMGNQGFNPWNLMLLNIGLSWFFSRRREELTWDMPRHVVWLLLIYLVFVLSGFFRLLDNAAIVAQYALLVDSEPPSKSGMWAEYMINTVKWVIPGLLLFDGCRDRNRFYWGLAALLGVYFLLGVQVIRWMPLDAIGTGEELSARGERVLGREIGYHRVNLAMMLAGASWAIFAARCLFEERRSWAWFAVAASLMVTVALVLTGGRTGYGTWAVVGLVLTWFRWRKYMLLAPAFAFLIILLVPSSMERISQGFTPESLDRSHSQSGPVEAGDGPDLYTITAGRNLAWPHVIEKIGEAPWFGHGREAMRVTGIAYRLWTELHENFPHPHSAYLQWLLDNGWIGLIPIALFYGLIMRYSISLFRDSRSNFFVASGGISLALVSAFLIASFGSESFYPREDAVGMWAAIGLMMRMHMERKRAMITEAVETVESAEAARPITDRLWQKPA
jgi:hypothetical protein